MNLGDICQNRQVPRPSIPPLTSPLLKAWLQRPEESGDAQEERKEGGEEGGEKGRRGGEEEGEEGGEEGGKIGESKPHIL
eukprot:450725-Hanusia_phi.AAC.3